MILHVFKQIYFLVEFIAIKFTQSIVYLFKGRRKITYSSNDAILITGCDSGIGLELAKHFYRTSRFKIICCFLSTDKSVGFSEINNLDIDGRIIKAKLDVCSDEDILNLKHQIEDWLKHGTFSRLVALINNAGTMTFGEFDWLTESHIDRQIDVNIRGPTKLTSTLLPHIIECRGRVINVSSVNDSTVFPGSSVYSATKAYLSTLSRCLSYEMRKLGVHVTTIRLGDFARLTNIMANHAKYRDEMWAEMSLKKQRFYKGYFDQFHNHILDNYGMTSPRSLRDSSLFQDFESALFLQNPPKTIVCAPMSFKIFYFIMEITPLELQHKLLDMMFRFAFKWKEPSVIKE